MQIVSDYPTDILSLYSNSESLIKDCSYIKSLLKNIPNLNSAEDFPVFFDSCFLECSYLLPDDCHLNYFKDQYADLYLILYESCLLTALSTIENLQHANKIMLALNAYRNFPYKKSNALESIYPTEKKQALYTVFEPKKKTTGNEKNAREAYIAVSETDGGLDESEYGNAPNTCITRYNNCQEGLSSLMNCFEITDSYKGSNQGDHLRYLHLTNLSWQINLLRHGEYNKNGYPNLIKQSKNIKSCLQKYNFIHGQESTDTQPSEITEKLTVFLKSFIDTHSSLIEEYNFYNDTVAYPHHNTDTLMSFQKTNLVLAPDIARLINANLNRDSFLDRKDILIYMIKKITIPFSRDIIINTFLSAGIINLDVFDTFFDVFYPLLVRVYLFSLLNFPKDEASLHDALENIREQLLNHIADGHYHSSEAPFHLKHFQYLRDFCDERKHSITKKKYDNEDIKATQLIYRPHKMTTYDLKACKKENARSNPRVYGFIHYNQPIIAQHKQYRSISGKENKYSLVRLATFISETYGCYPVISKHYYPPQIEENELENFSILVQEDICGTNTENLRLQYQHLATLNLDNARTLFQTEDWTYYKQQYLSLQEEKVQLNETILAKHNLVKTRLTQNTLDNTFTLLPNERKALQQYLNHDTVCSMLLADINKKYEITLRPEKVINAPKAIHLREPFGTTTRLGT